MTHQSGSPFFGSSPRARGTGRSTADRHRLRSVHPRVRGEQGKGATAADGDVRFIPACAGNSRPVSSIRSPASVHPRVRGEQAAQSRGPATLTAVHPRVRGEQVRPSRRWTMTSPVHPRVRGEQNARAILVAARHRFIPACAGNRLWTAKRDGRFHGSSPRARGTAVDRARLLRQVRFIPACAGNSASAPVVAASSSGSSPRARGTVQDVVDVRGS